MDLCTEQRFQCFVKPFSARSPRMAQSYSANVGRRPATSYSNRQGFSPSPRIQSAHSRVSMAATPKTQVSTAAFYDWSNDDVGDVSMATIYRRIAGNQKNRAKNHKHWCADGIHLNPGRMFVRDKADLTKGEREIIAGICKNRGDLNISKTGIVAHVRSHKDAWLTGKHNVKKLEPLDTERGPIKVPEHLFSKMETPKNSPRTFCYMCDQCRDTCLHAKIDKENKILKDEKIGRTAPPSSPSNSPKPPRKPLPRPNFTEGGVFVESGKTFIDPDIGSKKKKVFVDVFLPKFPQTLSTDAEPTSASIVLTSGDKCKTLGKEKFGYTKHQQKANGVHLERDHRKESVDGDEGEAMVDRESTKSVKSQKNSQETDGKTATRTQRRGNSSDGE